MRALVLALLLVPSVALTQTTTPPANPKKVLTPEQRAYQLRANAFFAERARLGTQAKTVYDAELAREKAPECPHADNTRSINECLAHEVEITQANYKAFVAAIRSMLGLASPDEPGPNDPDGPTGHPGTPATNTAAFDAAESAWQAYAKAECSAMDTLWRGGTIVNSIDMECDLRMARARMHELNTAYNMQLYH